VTQDRRIRAEKRTGGLWRGDRRSEDKGREASLPEDDRSFS
jgi:hypothetical protein